MDGFAWIGLVLLTERGVSAYHPLGRRLLKPLDHLGANVRTYVKHNGVPGIFFWSLECSSMLASIGARAAGIPYFPARMWRSVDVDRPVTGALAPSAWAGTLRPGSAGCSAGLLRTSGESVKADGDTFEFRSGRALSGSPSVSARWKLRQPAGDQTEFLRRAAWFVERYSVYAAWPWAGARCCCAATCSTRPGPRTPWSCRPWTQRLCWLRPACPA
eukprot:SRR837773.1452.p2 GENE.SRR837773.1452~~SRR837773.1452.p2  ORF type:complete len:242 (-),score=33.46 SRR837773.1452:42-689(-)